MSSAVFLQRALKRFENRQTGSRWSFNQCSAIGIKTEYYFLLSFAQLRRISRADSQEASIFSSRKTLRSLDDVEFESQGTLVDVVNNAHKRGLFKDIKIFR